MHSLPIGKKSTNTNTPKLSVQRQFLSVFSIDWAFSSCQLGVLASYRTVSHLINTSDLFLHGVFLARNTGVNQDSTRFVGKLCANINRCCHSLTVAAANIYLYKVCVTATGYFAAANTETTAQSLQRQK